LKGKKNGGYLDHLAARLIGGATECVIGPPKKNSLVGGEKMVSIPLKNDGVKVSWDDYSIPN